METSCSTSDDASENVLGQSRPKLASAGSVAHGLFFTGLILVAAVPLIVLRGMPVLQTAWLVPTFMLLALIWYVFWIRQLPLTGEPVDRKLAPGEIAKGKLARGHRTLISLLGLAGLSWVAFHVPQSWHFWGGYDDFQAMVPEYSSLWSETFDAINGRPALGMAFRLGHWTGNGSIEGFLQFASLMTFVNAVLLWSLLRTVMPGSHALAFAAAVTLIVNRSDPLKFYPLWAASPYALAVASVQFALLMFLISWRRQNRGLLIVACSSLGLSLLMYEVGYFVALIAPVLLILDSEPRRLRRFWIFSWFATVALFASRVVIFQLTHPNSYQLSQARESGSSPGDLLNHLIAHATRFTELLTPAAALEEYWAFASVLTVTIAALIWWLGRKDAPLSGSQFVAAGLISATAILLAVAPYSHMESQLRTQFFATPSQSILIALTAAWTAHWLPRSLPALGMGLVIGLFAANATVASYTEQSRPHVVTYRNVSHVCDQLRSIGVTADQESLIVLLHDGPSSVGACYSLFAGSPSWIGTRIITLGRKPDSLVEVEFGHRSVRATLAGAGETEAEYQNVILFQLESDGTLRLETTWPDDERLPEVAPGYAPVNWLKPNGIVERRNMHYPSRLPRPQDIIPHQQGIALGGGWSHRRLIDGELIRLATRQAELIINGKGQHSVPCKLNLACPDSLDSDVVIEARSTDSQLLGSWKGSERQTIGFTVPCQNDVIETVTLTAMIINESGNHPALLQAYCPGGPFDASPLPPSHDICTDDLVIGSGWYSVEYENGKAFRWLNTEAEIYSGRCAVGRSPALAMNVRTGPGLLADECEIQIISADGNVLARDRVKDGGRLLFALPQDLPEHTRMRVKVCGGGRQHGKDPRILNLRVDQCEWIHSAASMTFRDDQSSALRETEHF